MHCFACASNDRPPPSIADAFILGLAFARAADVHREGMVACLCDQHRRELEEVGRGMSLEKLMRVVQGTYLPTIGSGPQTLVSHFSDEGVELIRPQPQPGGDR